MNQDQREEIEALQSIFYDRYQNLELPTENFRISLENPVNSDLWIVIKYSENYPNDVPDMIRIDCPDGKIRNISDLEIELNSIARENTGMAMVMTLITEAEAWLSKKCAKSVLTLSKSSDSVEIEETRETAVDKEQITNGTPVTPESFLTWNVKFMEEVNSLKVKRIDSKKLTGKQLFEQNKSLISSDMLDDDETVIDESLYEGLEDLEIE